MPTPKEKGDALEYAVHQIEQVMHKVVPGLRGAKATIERNKRLTKDGVTYENDLWIELNQETVYPSTHVIECKNWNQPVGTEEVAKLVMKMNMLQLASGTIIAREFTRDATRLAALSRSVFLHHFSDNFWSPLDLLTFAATTTSIEEGAATVHFRNAGLLSNAKLPCHGTKCRYHGRNVPWDEFISNVMRKHLAMTVGRDPRFASPGLHRGQTEFSCGFARRELFVEGVEAVAVSVWLKYLVEAQAAKLAAKFDVEHRGGFIRMEYPPGTFGHDDVAMEIITKPSNPFQRQMVT